MSDITRTIEEIRPKLRHIAPQTFWFSLGFAIFNILVGLALYNLKILTALQIVGVIPLTAWGVIFITQGVLMLVSLMLNNWHITKSLNVIGVAVKTAWWLELLSITFAGRSPFLLYIWSLLLFFQVIVCIYFTPRVRRD